MDTDWVVPEDEICRLQAQLALWSSLADGLSAQWCALVDVLDEYAAETPLELRQALRPLIDESAKLRATARALGRGRPRCAPEGPRAPRMP
jgi:hypothetical protein